jgi:2,4-dienoyl-CoA reductase (NADPH2)
MARPLLADAAFVRKLSEGRPGLINLCIACNQACLDHYFTDQVITCVVNPRAAREGSFTDDRPDRQKRIAVVGAGVAGLACALEAAKRGHAVTLYDGGPEIGGQLRLASRVPGKEDYARALRGFQQQLDAVNVELRLGCEVAAETIAAKDYDEIVIATGVKPFKLDISGAGDARVVGYTEILDRSVIAGRKVVLVGGGGIGHDVALFLAHDDDHDATDVAAFERRWGIKGAPSPRLSGRAITMVKRSPGAFGRTLGKSTGWIVRQELRDFGVKQIAGATYLGVEPEGLAISVEGRKRTLEADTIVVCAGQQPDRGLADALLTLGQTVHIIGGARLASELDAKRAVDEGVRCGNSI